MNPSLFNAGLIVVFYWGGFTLGGLFASLALGLILGDFRSFMVVTVGFAAAGIVIGIVRAAPSVLDYLSYAATQRRIRRVESRSNRQ